MDQKENISSGSTVSEELISEAISLLKELIRTPSFSREEVSTADILQSYLQNKNISSQRIHNNIWATNKVFDAAKPTLLLNSHHDTVKPNKGYQMDPFDPQVEDGKLFGLGSNDAGGPLVSLLATFLYFYDKPLPFNILFAASTEEEISGAGGMELLLTKIPKIDFAIVGEPTLMNMAVAEKGLLVLDGTAKGKAGHAARGEGVNALNIAVEDISKLINFQFPKVSPLLGPVHLAVTSIHTENKAHNVVPEECNFVVDIRVNEDYTFEEILDILGGMIKSELVSRSVRLRPSFIPGTHPLVRVGKKLNLKQYGSPTCSDMALMNFPAIKMGPGDSARSHTADEFIHLEEIENGINTYKQFIENLVFEF